MNCLFITASGVGNQKNRGGYILSVLFSRVKKAKVGSEGVRTKNRQAGGTTFYC